MKLKLLLTVTIFTFIYTTSYSQTRKERSEITKNYDKQKLSKLSKRFTSEWQQNYNEAAEFAKSKNLPLSYSENGTRYTITHIGPEQNLVYRQTHGEKADINARVNHLTSGGSLGLNLQGEGMTAYIWDGGTALPTHEGYKDNSNNSRYQPIQGALGSHAAHVTGIIICNDTRQEAKGIAPAANAIGYEFSNDIAEAATEAANGMLISNHSYGNTNSTLADSAFGQYNYAARAWDELLFLTPYYTMVTSAGNDGNDDNSNARPLDNNRAFDKLSGAKCAKNTIVVANSANATLDSNGNLISVSKSSGSSEGPTDDYRIKPDIAVFGHGVFSTNAAATNHYSFKYGTSMAAPSVTGTILLLQQHGKNVNGKFFKAATVKGIALHTADDFGAVGPDANVGWGLINAKKAAQTISGNGNTSKVLELTLNQGQTLTLKVKSDDVNSLFSSISWTDPEGKLKTSTNNHSPNLINDLDIKVTKNTETHLPWKLNSVNTNSKGNNNVDPFERVDIENATGEYTITISHKGTLKFGKQDFSLVVTGIKQSFSISDNNTNVNFCKSTTTNPNLSFKFKQFGTSAVQLSTSNLPSGITANLSTNSISSDGTFNITLNNTETLTPGAYSFSITGTNGTDTYKTPVSFYIFESDFSNYPFSLNSPSNGSNSESITTTLKWNDNENATQYKYYLSKNAKFTSIISSGLTRSNSVTIKNLVPTQVYYWKVEPKNSCFTLSDVPVYNFQVGKEDCNNSYTNSTTVPINNTQDNSGFGFGNGFTLSAKSISDNYIITRGTVDIDITHSNTAELNIVLNNNYGADNPDNQAILLGAFNCPSGKDIKATYSDSGSNIVCGSSSPSISGTVKPNKSLSSLKGISTRAYWYLYTVDTTNGNNGTLNSFTLNFCVTKPINSSLILENKTINVVANTTSVINNNQVKTNSTNTNIYTITKLPTKGTIMKNGSPLVVGDTFTQNDINSNRISFGNTETVSSVEQLKVDVLNNTTKEWLANEIITLNINGSLSVNDFNDTISSLYPNPSSGEFKIQLYRPLKNEGVIKVIDIQGRTVHIENIEKSTQLIEINTARKLNTGMYFVNLTTKNINVTKKITIE